MFRIRLKELREKAELSQYAFAAEIGVAQSTVGSWESGAREPNFETTQRLADYFGVSVDYLLGREQKKETPAASLDPEETELLEKFNAFPGIVKSHILKYLDLIDGEMSAFSGVPLSEEQKLLLSRTGETFGGQSTDSHKDTG